MTVEEANKINDLYKQLDTVVSENASLKNAMSKTSTDDLVAKLDSIESKLDKLLGKSK